VPILLMTFFSTGLISASDGGVGASTGDAVAAAVLACRESLERERQEKKLPEELSLSRAQLLRVSGSRRLGAVLVETATRPGEFIGRHQILIEYPQVAPALGQTPGQVKQYKYQRPKACLPTPTFPFVSLPLKKIVIISVTYIPAFLTLSMDQLIVGMNAIKYVSSPVILKRIPKQIVDVGIPLNFEKMLTLSPDLVFDYPFEDNAISGILKVKQAGIPVAFVSDYLEPHLLGKAEWVKFFALFTEDPKKMKMANASFDEMEKNYLELVGQVQVHLAQIKKDKKNNKTKKKVFVGAALSGEWWIPKADSYVAALVGDAGGEFVTWDNKSNTTWEDVLLHVGEVDVWLPLSQWKDLAAAVVEDKRYQQFPLWQKKLGWNPNKKINAWGASDYWEGGLSHPDWLLRDLVSVIYPEMMPEMRPPMREDQRRWYHHLE
jgi:iron complex transport system substrate-binding protein